MEALNNDPTTCFDDRKDSMSSRKQMSCLNDSTTALYQNKNTYPTMLRNFTHQKGDKGAKLISALSQYIKNCSYKKGSLGIEDQEEILQEVLIKIHKNHRKIKTNNSGWLFKVTYNECMNKLNKVISSKNLVEIYSKNKMIKYDTSENEGIVIAKNDADAVNDFDCIEYVFTQATNTASGEDDKKLLHLYAAGCANKEIASNTKRSCGAITKKLFLLKKRIRQLIIENC